MCFYVGILALLLASLTIALSPNGPQYRHASNNAVAQAQPVQSDFMLVDADADAMEWDADAYIPDRLPVPTAEAPFESQPSDFDSLAPEQGSETAPSSPEILCLDDYLPECLRPVTANEADCLFPTQLPPAAHYFTGGGNPTSAAQEDHGHHLLFVDPECLDLHGTGVRARADAVDADRDAFDADVDRAIRQEDNPPGPQRPLPGEEHRFPAAPVQNDVQPSVEQDPIEEDEYEGTLKDPREEHAYEALHTGPDGRNGHSIGPEYVTGHLHLDMPVADDAVPQPLPPTITDSDRLGARQGWSSPETEAERRRNQDMIDAQPGKNVACDRCPRRFKLESGMLKHREKNDCVKYHCRVGDCLYCYWDAESVKRHRKTHNRTGDPDVDKMYVCKLCGSKQYRPDYLLRHFRSVHCREPTGVPAAAIGTSQQVVDTPAPGPALPSSPPVPLDPSGFEKLLNQIMDEDLRVDRGRRNKLPAVGDKHAQWFDPGSEGAPRHRAGGVPRILDVLVRPIDDDNDLDRRPVPGRPAPSSRLEFGRSSGQAGPSCQPSSRDTDRDTGGPAASRHRWSPYHQDVPPEYRQRRRGDGRRRRPVQFDVHSFIPDDADDNGASSDDEMDAEHEDEHEDDLYG